MDSFELVASLDNDKEYNLRLSGRQIATIIASLRYDANMAHKTLGALPIGNELRGELEDAYQAIGKQVKASG